MSHVRVVMGAHARKRMQQRSIDEELLLRTVKSPDRKIHYPGRYVAVKWFPERTVSVVCARMGNIVFVKTVW